MKNIKIILISIAILLFTSASSAQSGWWSASANVNGTPLRISGSVYNGFPRPIYCVGRVIGDTSLGQTLWSSFDAVINPGYNAYAYVYTNQNNPFVAGDANIQCRWY